MVARLDYGQRGIFTNALPDSGLVLDGGNISGTNMLDLQISGVSQFKVDKTGNLQTGSDTGNAVSLNITAAPTKTVTLGFKQGVNGVRASISYNDSSNNLQISGPYGTVFQATGNQGNVSITGKSQGSGAGGTLSLLAGGSAGTDVAGVNTTIAAGAGTGTGAGGSIVFQVAPAGSSGTAQNALVNALTIDSSKNATVAGDLYVRTDGYLGTPTRTTAIRLTNYYLGLNLPLNFNGGNGPYLIPESSNILTQQNGVNAQTSRIYGTYTDASNYERVAITANSTASYIQTENAGTGTTRPLYLGANNSTKMVVAANGNVGIGTTSPIQAMTVNGNIAFPDSGGSGTYNIKCWGYNDVINLNFSRNNSLTSTANDLNIKAYSATIIGTTAVPNVLSVSHSGGGQVLISGALGGPTAGLTNALGVGGGVAVGTYSIYGAAANAPSGGLIVSGDVGIGTTTPAYKLEVAGSFGATTVNVGNTTVNTVISSTTISLINIALVGF